MSNNDHNLSSKEIEVRKRQNLKEKPADDDLTFGRTFTDHMFVMEYSREKGWHAPRLEPYDSFSVDPAASFCHYSQMTFEGMKAYRGESGEALLFRPRKNGERFNNSNERMCIPQMDPDFFVKAVKKLVKVDKDWIPEKEGTALYIRPFVIATESYLGLKPADEFKFFIIASPVGPYYPEGLKPTQILVETEYVRSVKGGTGFAKTGGNYAGSLKAQTRARKKGYNGVLWLDACERKYIEEVGTMNVFFRIDDTIITPELGETILPGITRASVLELLRDWNEEIEERKLAIEEVYSAYQEGKLQEIFGTGTAAVIAPIGKLSWEDKDIKLDEEEPGQLTREIYDCLYGIQRGRVEDKFGWTVEV